MTKSVDEEHFLVASGYERSCYLPTPPPAELPISSSGCSFGTKRVSGVGLGGRHSAEPGGRAESQALQQCRQLHPGIGLRAAHRGLVRLGQRGLLGTVTVWAALAKMIS